jgi:ankyrin repeat protein
VVDRIGLRNTKTKYGFTVPRKQSLNFVDNKFVFYNAMIARRRKDFEELASNLTSESLNSVDSDGYTLLEWATVFSTSDWPIDQQFLKEKGAETPADEGLFRRNVFFIALKFLNPDKDGQTPSLAFDGVDICGVNQSGDTALHLSLEGGKGQTAKKILSHLKEYDVNTTDSKGYTPLHLAIRLQREFDDLIKKILARTNSESVNTQDKYGNTALHFAILSQSKAVVELLLKRKDVDVNVKNNDNHTALHFATVREDFSFDLFRIILEKSNDVNAQDKHGWTALIVAIRRKSETAQTQGRGRESKK